MRGLGSANATLRKIGLAAAMLAGTSVATLAQAPAASTAPPVIFAPQGWSDADRASFYTTGQGSHLIPFAWFKALQQKDSNQPFMADQLARYGYLHNDGPNDLPVGFVVEARTGQLGMTCAACHTNQLEYQKDGKTVALRLDGAPALADFQQFLLDLTAASRATVSDAGRFDTFAKAVLGGGYTPARATQLKTDFGGWVKQFGDFMDASLPASPWGPGRLDAFGMIFNRVAARDLGLEKAPHNNFRFADAPVSYPFVWNASRQDHTQWNGAVPNGLFIQALVRNTGEVYGVFADFKPKIKVPAIGAVPTLVDFKNNSADFNGLQTLEEKIAALKPPPWPRDIWPINDDLAKKGAGLFKQYCAECHEQRPSKELPHAWLTPVRAVGTDPKMATNAARTSEPGIYTGALRPPPALFDRFTNPASTAEMLAFSVIGSILDEAFDPPITPQKINQSGVWRAIQKDIEDQLPEQKLDAAAEIKLAVDIKQRVTSKLANMFVKPHTADDTGAAYESRVLYGIWATAPYLHNGSVPSLWELMLPPERRSTSFKVGSRKFDPKNVGYATDESPYQSGTYVVDPQNANGNGNGGHVYGKDLSDDDRWALVEYLKTL